MKEIKKVVRDFFILLGLLVLGGMVVVPIFQIIDELSEDNLSHREICRGTVAFTAMSPAVAKGVVSKPYIYVDDIKGVRHAEQVISYKDYTNPSQKIEKDDFVIVTAIREKAILSSEELNDDAVLSALEDTRGDFVLTRIIVSVFSLLGLIWYVVWLHRKGKKQVQPV